jgi:hypothetical protein
VYSQTEKTSLNPEYSTDTCDGKSIEKIKVIKLFEKLRFGFFEFIWGKKLVKNKDFAFLVNHWVLDFLLTTVQF